MPFRRAPRATAYDAIAYLASACDGARRRDDHGFNAEHVEIGHRLARATRWSRRDHRAARKLIRFYRRQLTGAGYEVAALASRRGQEQRHRETRSPRWSADPTGLHRWRLWDGCHWTNRISDSTVRPARMP